MDEFIKTSQELGKNILYVQGAGGNASIKLRNKMFIKASGYKLKTIDSTYGIACCSYEPIVKYIKTKNRFSNKDEEPFLNIVASTIIDSKTHGAPSMETGFHAVLPSKYVFHLHSVYGNIFGCMKNGSSYFKKVYRQYPYIFVDYKNPGYELAYILSKKKTLPPLIILKNHGLIVHANTISDCTNIIESLHSSIETYLINKKVFHKFRFAPNYKPTSKYSFPDSAVFSTVKVRELPKKKEQELIEITSAQEYIIHTIENLGYKPTYLNQQAINKLVNMKQEKHRLDLFKK